MRCAQILAAKLEDPEEEQVWLHGCGASFAAMIRDKQSREALEAKATVGLPPPCLACAPEEAACSVLAWEGAAAQCLTLTASVTSACGRAPPRCCLRHAASFIALFNAPRSSSHECALPSVLDSEAGSCGEQACSLWGQG